MSRFLVFFLVLFSFLAAPLLLSAASPPESRLSQFKLVDEKGKPFQLSAFENQNLFISFVYTRCPMPKMCPLTMQLNKQLFRKWKSTAPQIPLHFLIVTLDPENDTPAELSKYGKKFGLDPAYFTFATGEPKTLSDFAAEFNTLGFPSNGMISHSVKSILLGPKFFPIKEYKENEWSPSTVLTDLQQHNLQSSQKQKTP